MIKKLAYLIIITLCICCKSDDDAPDCSLIDCITLDIVINLIDDVTKENIIIQNSFKEEDIIIRDASNNLKTFIINQEQGLLIINKDNRNASLEIVINSEVVTNFSYDISDPKTNECCDFGELTYVLPDNQKFELDNRILTIYL